MISTSDNSRLYVVDALRGFAIVSIMLLHNIEHFDVYVFPTDQPSWLVSLDKGIWETLFFLFGGKSFAIFALLFGLTFYIQSDNQEKKGNDFRGRFAWRLLLLFAFGIVNSAFFQGDILTIYAAIGFLLIPMAKLNSKILAGIAVILFMQPLEIIHLIEAIKNPEMKLSDPASWTYFGKMGTYITGDSLLNTMAGNLTNGKTAVLLWNHENGRFFQILALFLMGILAGRNQLFVWSDKSQQFWKRTLLYSIILFVPLFIIQKNMEALIGSEAIRRSVSTIETSWANLAFMLVLVSGFVLLFHSKVLHSKLQVLSPIGKMSLSNYLLQSIVGATLYYGFGFALYQYTGPTLSLIIGIVLSILFILFCTYWAKRFKQGPLETLWHKATWIGRENTGRSAVTQVIVTKP